MWQEQKKWHSRRSRVCHWCSYHILTSSVIYYWTYARQHGIYVFYMIKLFLFQNISTWRESQPLPTLAKTKNVIWRNLWSIQNEAIALVTMRNKELWLVEKIAPLSNLTRASVSFCHRSNPVSRKALTLPWKLQELKKYHRKTCGCSQTKVIWFEFACNELKGAY